MKYQGSKNRHAKHLLKCFIENGLYNQDVYIEPFVGGANMIDKVDSSIKRYGYDINPYLIACLKSFSNGIIPVHKATEESYKNIKNNKDYYDEAVVGYYGFALSYGGKFFGGWCRDGEGKRDYVVEAYRNAEKQVPLLLDVNFECRDYRDISIPENAFVYCDPPYEGTTEYSNKFNHQDFWNWCRKLSKNGTTVLISEYNAPSDFDILWEKKVTSSLTRDTGSKVATEKLFKYKG